MMKEANRLQISSEVDSFTEERYLQMIQAAANKQFILDVGCNTGRGGTFLKKVFPGSEIDGVEILQERIDKIPDGVYRKVYCEYIEKLDLPADSYDAIIAGEFVEHIYRNDLINLLRKFRNALRKGGSIVFTTPNPRSFLVMLGRDGVLKEPSHVNILTVGELKQLILTAGFRITSINGCGKMTRYLGDHFPVMGVYGSYLISAVAQPEHV